jgi:hypothetical protein
MGIYAKIYSSSYGRDPLSVIPSAAQEVLVINADGPFEPKAGVQLVRLEGGYAGSAVRAVPINANGSKAPNLMFGGRFIASSDSRFGRAVERERGDGAQFYGAVPLHDRYEG